MGEGWGQPFVFSLASFIMAPLGVKIILAPDRVSLTFLIFLIAVSAILDVWLYVSTLTEGTRYFFGIGGVAYIWIAIWASWQVALVFALYLKLSRVNSDGRHLDV
jgi:hypothetical protein